MATEDLDDLAKREGIDAVRARCDAAEVVNFEAEIAAIGAELDRAGTSGRDTLARITIPRLRDECHLSDGEIKQHVEPIVGKYGLYNAETGTPVVWSKVLQGAAAEASGAREREAKAKRGNGGASPGADRGEGQQADADRGGTGDDADKRKHKAKAKPRGKAKLAAVRQKDEELPPPKSPDDYGAERPPNWCDLGTGGKPAPTCANASKAIEALGIECRYDIFHDRKLVGGHAIEQWAGELSDHACLMLRKVIKQAFGFDPGRENTHDAAMQLCLQRQFDPVCDYLDGIQWDKLERLDTWMTTYLGADDTPLNRAIGRLTLVAAVRRVRQPGCKFDQIPVLEGPEGTGKSSAIEILAGKENFSDQTILGLDDRQQQEAVRGAWLFEIADLAGMSKADVDKTKAFASRLSDRARPAYGRAVVALPRRCIFIATTNNDTYLKSQTGNRRFWPVKTDKIDIAALSRDRDQLWAEAAQLEAAGAALKLPETLWATAAAEQDRRRDPDPWDDILAGVKGELHPAADGRGEEERIATTALLSIHLRLPADKANDVSAKRLSFCMRRIGWKGPDPIRIAGRQQRGYRRPIIE